MLPASSKFAWTMGILLSCTVLSVCRGASTPTQAPPPKVDHTGGEFLDNNQKYWLSWRVNTKEKRVYFEVTAETKGFVGFGISPNGGMTGADILIAGVNPDGSLYGKDYHGVGNTRPVEDAHADWNVTEGVETGTNTTLRFNRLLNTCDGTDDLQITNGTMRLIWAMGETDEIRYHKTNRGTKSVNFYMNDEYGFFKPDQYQKFDMVVSMEMPAQDTTYWCSIHKGPVFNLKHHIVAFDALLNSESALQHTHHFVLSRCIAPPDQDPEALFEPWASHPGEQCFLPSNASFPYLEYCSRHRVYMWSKGGKLFVFPPNMGLPVPDQLGRREYYALEVHYDNPNSVQGLTFQTGARIYYTNVVREIEVGFLLMDHNVVPQLTVPPKTSNYIVIGHCSSECTKKFLKAEGITIFNNMFHTHLAGRKLKLRHFRGNQELQWVDNEEYFDFDFQQDKRLPSPRKVLPGDQLTVECTYDSMRADGGKAIIGGPSTHEEMCEAAVYYYPRQALAYCGSEQDVAEHFSLLGMTNYTLKDPALTGGYPGYDIVAPANLAGDYRDSVSFKVNWTREFRERFQREKRYGEQIGTCEGGESSHSGVVKYPENMKEYVPPNECAK